MNNQEETNNGQRPTLISLFSVIRYVVGFAVVGVVVGSAVLMLLGVIGVLYAVFLSITNLSFGILDDLRIALIEATDTFLVSTALFVIAIGLFQLFVNPNASRHLPPWLRVEELDALEDRMIGMVVAVGSVVFLTLLLEWHGQFNILEVGVAVGAVIIAASFFVYASARKHEVTSGDSHGEKHDEEGDDR